MRAEISELAPGIRVGHWTGAATGVTVVLCPPGTVGSGEVRGGAPATRETALLEPGRSVEAIDAVVFSGGSAFGLAAADGVMVWLAEQGRGFPTRGGPVPIVPGAAIFDLAVAGSERLGAAEGRAAIEAASSGGGPIAVGRVGAGRGASVGKWRGPEFSVPGGLGVARVTIDGVTVGALAVVNALGDVVAADGRPIAASTAPADVPPFPDADAFGGDATTLVLVATDAALTKPECHLVAQSGHVGVAHAVRPSHTRHDGDLVIALATGRTGPSVGANLDRLRIAATDVVAEAIRGAVRTS